MVVLVEGAGAVETTDGVYVVRAESYREAFSAALKIGRREEREYTNADGARVRWRLAEVLQIHWVEAEALDGCEVMAEFLDAEPPAVGFDAVFQPEASTPKET
jgi:hypothetical protein